MAGGTASGKTEYAKTYLTNNDQLVYDGTLKNFDGLKVKGDKIKRYAKHHPKIKIVYIIPYDWKGAFEVFLSRSRKMNKETFFETQVKSMRTISRVFTETDYRVEIYVSSFNEQRNKMIYHRLKVKGRNKKSILFKKLANAFIDQAKEYNVEIKL